MTHKYFRLERDLIVASPILIIAVSTFCLLLIRTASVLCAARASPLESSHALARFPASLQILSASGSFLAVTSMATSSAKPMTRAPSGIVILRIPSYMTFHRNVRKQYCISERPLVSTRAPSSREWIILSRMLPTVASMQSGLHEEGSSAGFSRFGMSTSRCVFKRLRNTPFKNFIRDSIWSRCLVVKYCLQYPEDFFGTCELYACRVHNLWGSRHTLLVWE